MILPRLVAAGLAVATLLCASVVVGARPLAAARITFDRHGILHSETQGYADIAQHRLLTIDDPVRVASISKLVVAIAVLRLVEQRTLDLDADVSRWLEAPLRHPQHPKVPITLRMLLSHRSGLTDRAGYVIPYDTALRDTLQNPGAWDTEHAPGTFFRYANLNLPVVAAVMERATGERFDRLMRRLVLAPLALDACFNWQGCSTTARSRAVVLYEDGRPIVDAPLVDGAGCVVVRGTDGSCDLERWRVGRNGAMFSPQGGLRISARDLTTIGRFLLGNGTLDGRRLLAARSMRTLLTPQWTYAGRNGIRGEEDDATGADIFCRYGLALQFLATPAKNCADDPRGDGRVLVGHAGAAYGLLSGLWVDRSAGTGVAYFATDAPEASGAHSAFRAIEERLLSTEPLSNLVRVTGNVAP